jgi:hypothetical protein
MSRVNITDTYLMGRSFRTLEQIQAGLVPATIVGDLIVLRGWLDYLLSIKLLPKGEIQRQGSLLHSAVSNMISVWLNEPLTADRASIIQSLFGFIEPILSSEFARAHTYFVPQVGIYSTDSLISEPEKMFGENVELLPEITVKQIREAGKCLAFSLASAASFHLFAALESVLRVYYDALSGGAPPPKNPSMGAYLGELSKLQHVDKKLLAALWQVKDLHRNPAIHFEVILTPGEALTLMGMIHSAISTTLDIVSKLPPSTKL